MFIAFVKKNTLLHLTEQSVIISGDLYAQLRKKGNPIDDIDLLIAGIALENNLVLVTNNRKHFERITQLEIVDWSLDM
jgi:tRNA(fMet)-specific endonuclease VapC